MSSVAMSHATPRMTHIMTSYHHHLLITIVVVDRHPFDIENHVGGYVSRDTMHNSQRIICLITLVIVEVNIKT